MNRRLFLVSLPALAIGAQSHDGDIWITDLPARGGGESLKISFSSEDLTLTVEDFIKRFTSGARK